MKELVQNKWFWVALMVITIVPFIFLWIAESLMVAIVTYAVIGGGALFFIYQIKEKRSRRGSPGSSRVIIEDRRQYGRVQCPQCDGEGTVQCDRCDGRGRVMNIIDVRTCSRCNGRKTLRCRHCGGRGSI